MKSISTNLRALVIVFAFVVGGSIDGKSQGGGASGSMLSFQQVLDAQGLSEFANDYSDLKKFEIAEPSLAYVNITGISKMPTKKTDNLNVWMEVYDGNGNYFKKRVIIHAQGNSSLNFVKKNFSADFCEDEWVGNETPSLSIGEWVAQDSYHFKAYYTDYLRGASVVGYQMFDQFQASGGRIWTRADVPSPNEKARCFPDGFPTVVYLNGGFYGLFSWQLKKQRKNYNLTKNVPEHIHLDGTLRQDSIWNGLVKWGSFEVRNPKGLYTMDGDEYDGDHPQELIDEASPHYNLVTDGEKVRINKQNTAKVKHYIEALSKLRPFLVEMENSKATQDEMRTEIEKHFDIPSLIDYCCFHFVANNYDGFGKNWQWITYDGLKWFVAPYDLDCIFGNFSTGTVLFPPEWDYVAESYRALPSNGPIYFIKKYYWDDIKARYADLRDNGILSSDNIKSLIKNWYYRFGDTNYTQEYEMWNESKCISGTICNENWQTTDDWTNYLYTEDYDKSKTYRAGDKCRLAYRIWTATGETVGVNPYKQLGYRDSLDRICDWIDRRIKLIDAYLGYMAPTYPMSSYTLHVDKSGWTTLCLPFSYELPAQLTAYTVTGLDADKQIAELESVSVVEANKPYLINGAPGNYLLTGQIESSDEELVKDLLHGTFSPIRAPQNSYVLKNHNGKAEFRLACDNDMIVSDNHAYLVSPDLCDDLAEVIHIDTNPGIITNIGYRHNQYWHLDNAIYSPMGYRVSQMKRGINLIKSSGGKTRKVLK